MKKYTFEFYCFIYFKMQNGAFQANFYEFGSGSSQGYLRYRIVPKTTPRYMKFSQIKIRAVHEVVLFQGSCYITFLKIVQPMTILNSYASRPIKLLIYLSHTLAILNPTSHCSRMHVQNTCTCIFSIFRKIHRVIKGVVLYLRSRYMKIL